MSAMPPRDADLSLILSRLARSAALSNGNLSEALTAIMETAATALRVARVNIWLFDEPHTEIACVYAFQAGQPPTGAISAPVQPYGERLFARDNPAYFEALENLRAISVIDTLNDPRTVELAPQYLQPHGITTMLDAPIYLSGNIIGIVCHEHTCGARTWTGEEQSFAGSIADLISISFETDRRLRAEQRAQELQAKMLESQRLESLGLLAGGVAHDFNNLLATILGNAGLALRNIEDLSKVQTRLLDIQTAAERAADLCKQLLAFSGKGELFLLPVNLSLLVHEIVRLLKVSISPNAQLRCELSEELPVIQADATQLRQVALNLVTNASEALAGNEGVITVRTGFDYFDRGELERFAYANGATSNYYVFIEVSDTGDGMDAETRKRLFEPFYTTKATGNGLGLAVVLGIIRSHKGAIQVESEIGNGTTIRAFFPAR